MPIFLLRSTRQEDRNSSGINGVLINAADAAAARTAAKAASPNGESKIHDSWVAEQLTTGENMNVIYNPIWIQ